MHLQIVCGGFNIFFLFSSSCSQLFSFSVGATENVIASKSFIAKINHTVFEPLVWPPKMKRISRMCATNKNIYKKEICRANINAFLCVIIHDIPSAVTLTFHIVNTQRAELKSIRLRCPAPILFCMLLPRWPRFFDFMLIGRLFASKAF